MTLCPLDGKDDAIQRVAALVAEDSVYSPRSGGVTSGIGCLLAPPEEPKRPDARFFLLWCVPYLLAAMILLPLVFPMVVWVREFRRECRARRNHVWNTMRWHKAMDRWEKLFYCHRCGVVFDPEGGAWRLPNDLDRFLHDE
jgi:hypothetical protein